MSLTDDMKAACHGGVAGVLGYNPRQFAAPDWRMTARRGLMTRALRLVLILVLATGPVLPAMAESPASAGRDRQMAELIQLHDLNTSVSIGTYYLKQEGLIAIRSLLARLGREESLGPDWNASNPTWQRAEAQLLQQTMAQVATDFASLDWLRPQWQALGSSEFSDEELDVLLDHFRSAVGRKQVKIVDHTISTHVMTTLSFSGKLRDIPGIEEERVRMQHVWNKEDDEMRFSIGEATNHEGTRFALSPLGKKYFVTAMLKVTGLVSRRIDDLAGAIPAQVNAHADQVRPLVEEFKGGRS